MSELMFYLFGETENNMLVVKSSGSVANSFLPTFRLQMVTTRPFALDSAMR